MSYHVYLCGHCEHCGRNADFSWNFTSNGGRMWTPAGADLASFHGKKASECIPALETAIAAMTKEPGKFRALEPANGWGSFDDLLPALIRLLEGFRSDPTAEVIVSR